MRWGGGKIKTSLTWALVLIWVLVGWKFVGLSSSGSYIGAH
jgi:hypothetical protein